MAKSCILCGANSPEAVDKVASAELARLYGAWLARDVSDEFGNTKVIELRHCRECDLKFFDPCLPGSARFYETLSGRMEHDYYLGEKSEYHFAARQLAPGSSVLDVGSGAGLFQRYVPGDYTGLDFNPAAVEAARRRGVRVLNENIGDHARANPHHYDVVTCFQILEHVPHPRAFLAECAQALRPGGLLIVSVPSEDSYIPHQPNAILNMPPHHVSRWTDRCLNQVSGLLGLELVAIEHEPMSEHHADAYFRLVAERTVVRLTRCRRSRLVDTSRRARLVRRLSRCLTPLVKKVLDEPAFWPHGHSVSVIYRKPVIAA